MDDRRRRETAERFLARATAALNGTLDYEGALRAITQLSLEELADGCVVHLARADGGFEVAAVASRDDVEGTGETGAVEAHGNEAGGHAAHEMSLLVPEVDDAALAAVATCHEHLDRLRRLGLRGTSMAHAECQTIRLKLLKIGAQVRVTTRKVWVLLASGCPYAPLFAAAYANLRGSPARS